MIDAKSHISILLHESKKIELGRPEKAILIEQAVQLADAHNEIELAYNARQELVKACYFSGQPDKAIVAFSWCLAQHDKHPGKFDEWLLMWTYKWIIEAVIKFPQIPLTKIDELVEDATRRFEPFEGGLRALYELRTGHYHHIGLTQQAERTYEQWQEAPCGVYGSRTGLSNCHACEILDEVMHKFFCGRYAEGIDAAAPVLAQRVTCLSTGKVIFASVLVPLVRLGELDRARTYHQTGYRLISTNMTFLEFIACHINYATIVNKLEDAVKMFGKHLEWALEAVTLTDVFDFYLASRLLFTRLKEKKEHVTLRLPKTFPIRQDSGRYDVQALIVWLDEQLHSIAAKFDERNKTDRFSGRIDKSAELQALFLP